MDFFTKKEFETLNRYAKKSYDKTSDEGKAVFKILRTLYDKVDFLAGRVQEQFYPEGANNSKRNPLNNNGTSFMEYLWAKIYPTKEDEKKVWLAYTVAVTSDKAIEIKIDTVKLNDKDGLRQRYFEYRGDYHASAIVKIIPYQEALQHDWDWLVEETGEFFKSIELQFEELKNWVATIPSNSQSQPLKDKAALINGKKLPSNLILYGPPGTGKTYYLKSQCEHFTTSPQHQTKEQFHRELVAERTWWEILAVCLYERKKAKVPELLKHPLIVAKFAQSDIQHPSQRIWSTLQIHTVDECEHVKLTDRRRHGVSIFYKEADSTWRLDEVKSFEEQFGELVELFKKYEAGPAKGVKTKRYFFTTFHQSLAYEDFIEGIKPQMAEPDDIEKPEDLGYRIEKGIFYQACEEAARLAGYQNLRACLEDSEESRKARFEAIQADPGKQFCIFLDEINRANISSVFGELITLIEDDKRLGAAHEIIVDKMPYSKRSFGIPPNLHIIGTMNTADRSVEALDTALRRRFEFREMTPRPELISPQALLASIYNEYYAVDMWHKEPYQSQALKLYHFLGLNKDIVEKRFWDKKQPDKWRSEDISHVNDEMIRGIQLDKLLETVNNRIEKLMDKDHKVGHAYFMGIATSKEPLQELKRVFQHRILPLLQEYFFGDIGKISLVIGEGFFEKNTNDVKFMTVGWYDAAELTERRVDKMRDVMKMDDKEFTELVKAIYQ